MLTAEEGVDLLGYDRPPGEEHRWDREERRPWVVSASRWLQDRPIADDVLELELEAVTPALPPPLPDLGV